MRHDSCLLAQRSSRQRVAGCSGWQKLRVHMHTQILLASLASLAQVSLMAQGWMPLDFCRLDQRVLGIQTASSSNAEVLVRALT